MWNLRMKKRALSCCRFIRIRKKQSYWSNTSPFPSLLPSPSLPAHLQSVLFCIRKDRDWLFAPPLPRSPDSSSPHPLARAGMAVEKILLVSGMLLRKILWCTFSSIYFNSLKCYPEEVKYVMFPFDLQVGDRSTLWEYSPWKMHTFGGVWKSDASGIRIAIANVIIWKYG